MAQRKGLGREGHWRSVIQRQESSGMSIVNFCRQYEVPVSSFYSWKRKLKQRRHEDEPTPASKAASQESARDNTASRFVPVELHGPLAVSRASSEVVLPDGSRVIFSSQCDPDWLREILQVVQERSC